MCVCVCVNEPINSNNGGTFCNELNWVSCSVSCLRRIDERFVDVTSGDTTNLVGVFDLKPVDLIFQSFDQ